MDAYKQRHTLESKMRELRERECRAKDVRNVGESGLPRQPAVAAIAALKREKQSEVESCQRGDDSSSSIVVNLVLSLYNAMASPVDVGSLPNHVKYCVSVLYLLMGKYQNITGRNSLHKLVKKWQKTELKRKFFKRNGGLLLQQELRAAEGWVQKTTCDYKHAAR